MNEKGVDFVKFPDGRLVTRLDCEEAISKGWK
jgi:hypothetical protein